MGIKPIINLATKYTDDVIGIGVRKWTKPTNLEGLRLAPKITKDTVHISQNCPQKIMKLVDSLPVKVIPKEGLQMIDEVSLGTSYLMDLAIPTFNAHLANGMRTIKSKLMSLPLDNKTLQAIKNANPSDELSFLLKDIFVKQFKDTLIRTNKVFYNNALPAAEKQRLISAIKKEDFSWTFNMYKALSLKSTNPRVLQIEKILKQKYGMDFVALNDDVVHAEKLLRACELMHKNGDKLVKNYIVTDMMPATGKCLGTESAVLHSSTNLDKILNPCSTEGLVAKTNELHTILHEFGHFLQPSNIDTITIPKHLEHVRATVSDYAKISGNAELFAELFAKIRLTPEKVTREELELFEFLKNVVL